MKFQYIAYALNQGIVRGEVEARTPADVQAEIRSMGLKSLVVKRWSQPLSLRAMFPSLFHIKPNDLIRICRHTASLLRSGGSLVRALEMLEEEAREGALGGILRELRATLNYGGSFSDALKEHPDVFSPLFVNVVEVGEFAGQLAPALEQLADLIEREQEAKQKAMKTLMYPMAIVGLAIVTMSVMFTVAMPPMLKVFKGMGSDVPFLTRLTLGLFVFVRAKVFFFIGATVLLIALMKLAKGVPTLRYRMDALQIKTPVLGKVLLTAELSRFCRTMAILLEAGVSLATAVRLAISGCKNQVVRKAFLAGEESLLSGRGFTATLKRYPIIPSLFVEMARIGEMSNTLKKTMRDAAEAYQKQLEQRLNGLLSLIEPLSTLAVGAIVALMAFSMLLPIYTSLRSIK